MLKSYIKSKTFILDCIFLFLFCYVWFQTAWASDDAYITFRTVKNFVRGYGLVWNIDERVQSFSNPLWLFLLIISSAVSQDLYINSMLLSLVFSIAAVGLVLWRLPTKSYLLRTLLLLLLISSKALIDYSSSGLENPLNYVLLAILITDFLLGQSTYKSQLRIVATSSLLFLSRIDTITFTAPVMLWSLYHYFKEPGGWSFSKKIGSLLLVSAPAWGWLAFSTFYYGFPLPNTFYAKVTGGYDRWQFLSQGWHYFVNSVRYDSITLTVIGVAIFCTGIAYKKDRRYTVMGLGILLHLSYVILIGGDFMSGRFFSQIFFVSVIMMYSLVQTKIIPLTETFAVIILLALCAWNVRNDLAPIKNPDSYPESWDSLRNHGIADERGVYHSATSLRLWLLEEEIFPKHEMVERARAFVKSTKTVTSKGVIGFYGYNAGDKVVVDYHALADALLARLPASRKRIGHFSRGLPMGYRESRIQGDNEIKNLEIKNFYDKLRPVIQGPLLSVDRLNNIFYLNFVKSRIPSPSWVEELSFPKQLKVKLAQKTRSFRICTRINGEQFDQPTPEHYVWDDFGNVIFNRDCALDIRYSTYLTASKIIFGIGTNKNYKFYFLNDGTVVEEGVVKSNGVENEITPGSLERHSQKPFNQIIATPFKSLEHEEYFALGFVTPVPNQPISQIKNH